MDNKRLKKHLMPWWMPVWLVPVLLVIAVALAGHPFPARSLAAAVTGVAAEDGQKEGGAAQQQAEHSSPEAESDSILASVRAPRSRLPNVDVALLDGVAIPAESLFSLREHVPEHKVDDWPVAASLLLEAALKAGLEVAERHTGMALPEGVKPGYEARLEGKRRDLKLFNALPFDVRIEAESTEDAVGFRIAGRPPAGWSPPAVSETVERYAPGTMIIANGSDTPYVPQWTKREGLLVRVYRTENNERRLLYKDFYAPFPDVIVYRQEDLDDARDGM